MYQKSKIVLMEHTCIVPIVEQALHNEVINSMTRKQP